MTAKHGDEVGFECSAKYRRSGALGAQNHRFDYHQAANQGIVTSLGLREASSEDEIPRSDKLLSRVVGRERFEGWTRRSRSASRASEKEKC